MSAYELGYLCGILVVIAAAFIIRRFFVRRFGRKANQYDERQIAEQGKAAHHAMNALLLMIIIYGVFSCYFPMLTPIIASVCIAVSGMAVYAGICIANEAYFPINGSLRAIIVTCSIGAFNIFIAAWGICTKGWLDSDGNVQTFLINLVIGIECIIIPLIAYLKASHDAGKEEE